MRKTGKIHTDKPISVEAAALLSTAVTWGTMNWAYRVTPTDKGWDLQERLIHGENGDWVTVEEYDNNESPTNLMLDVAGGLPPGHNLYRVTFDDEVLT